MLRAAPGAVRCEEIADRLSEFLDGELDGPASARVGLHLATCRGCARIAAELDATIRALHRLPRPSKGLPGRFPPGASRP